MESVVLEVDAVVDFPEVEVEALEAAAVGVVEVLVVGVDSAVVVLAAGDEELHAELLEEEEVVVGLLEAGECVAVNLL